MENNENLDRVLASSLPDIASGDDELLLVNPFRKPMLLLVWGFLLTTVTLNFLSLQYILPTCGMSLLYLGFRSLRRENSAFYSAWVLSAIRAVLHIISLTLAASPAAAFLDTELLGVPTAIIQIAQLIFFRKAVDKVYGKIGAKKEHDPILWLLISTLVITVLALLNFPDSILLLPFAIFYIVLICSLLKIPKAFENTGYSMKNAPVKINAVPLFIGYAALTLAAVLTANIISCHDVPESTDFEGGISPALYESLSEKGLPDYILNDLTEDTASLFSDAVKIEHRGAYAAFSALGCTVAESTGALPEGRTVIHAETVYIEVPGKKIYVIQYFRYLKGGAYWGDGFDIWYDNDAMSPALAASALLWEEDGTSKTAEVQNLYMGLTKKLSFLFGESNRRAITGTITYPFGAENQRGYVIYSYNYEPGRAIVCGSLDFLRRTSPINFPFTLASDDLLTGQYNYNDFFQNYTTFYTYGEYYDRMEKEEKQNQ